MTQIQQNHNVMTTRITDKYKEKFTGNNPNKKRKWLGHLNDKHQVWLIYSKKI